jgi:hypothetical protein
MSPVRYKLGFYIPEDGILHSHRRENLNPYVVFRLSAKLLPNLALNFSSGQRFGSVRPLISVF